MTQDTEKERAEFIRWHIDVSGASEMGSAHVWDNRHLIAQAWQAARRAPVVPVTDADVRKMRAMVESGQAEEGDLLALFDRLTPPISIRIAAAPQPPEGQSNCASLEQLNENNRLQRSGNPTFKTVAAPVELPEPAAWIRKTDITELTDSEPETDGWTPLYSESALLEKKNSQ